jgi:hypothetical protein
MKSAVTKRSIKLDGRKTSVALEDAFWNELKEIAYSQGVTRIECGHDNRCHAQTEQSVVGDPRFCA